MLHALHILKVVLSFALVYVIYLGSIAALVVAELRPHARKISSMSTVESWSMACYRMMKPKE